MEAEDLIEEIEIIEVDLPSKILFEIFKFLHIRDRRNIRLVCKQWLEVCNDRKFQEKEAFFFNNSFKFPVIVKIIADSGRERVNLKLESYMLNEGSNCLWQTHGSKIISLKLDSCKLGATILGHIIFSCPNMTEFCVNDGYYNMGSFGFPGMFLCTKFKHPQEGTFKREKLEKLTFDADEMPVIYPDLERFYTYFPNVKSLNINLCTEEPLEKKKDLTHFQALLTLISQETSKIDTLFINFHDDETYLFKDLPVMKLKCMADYDLSKLKDVGMRLVQCTLNDDSLNTILRYKFWTSLHITLHRIAQEKFNKFLLKLLKECPSLRILETHWKISKSSQFFSVFPAIVKSHLEILSLEIDDRTMPEDQGDSLEITARTSLKGLTKNDSVRQLTLKCANARGFTSIFVEHFPKVRHLELSHGSLETVFTCLPNLLSLQVGNYASYYKSWNKTARTSVPILQYMSLSVFDFENFSEIEFPDLKYLSLIISSDELWVMYKTGGFDEYYDEDEYDPVSFSAKIASILSLVTQKAPNLRGLSFNFSDLNNRNLKCETGNCNLDVLVAFFKSCQNLHQLRYASVRLSPDGIEEEFCKKHMMECYKGIPSLRAFHCISISSFFNILEKKVEFTHDFASDLDMMDYWTESR